MSERSSCSEAPVPGSGQSGPAPGSAAGRRPILTAVLGGFAALVLLAQPMATEAQTMEAEGDAAEGGCVVLLHGLGRSETSLLVMEEMLGAAGLGETPEGFGGGAGEDQFASFLRQEQAQGMVAGGGIGLAESIFHALKRRAGDAE